MAGNESFADTDGGLARSTAGAELYRQLRRHAQLAMPGEMIAGERELAEVSGISRVTVRKVLSQLVAEGLLVRRHGSGTFVASRPNDDRPIRQVIFADDFPDLAHPYATSLLSGVLHQAEAGLRIQVIHFRGNLLDPANLSLLNEIRRPDIAGLILPALDAPLYQDLKAANPALRIVHTLTGCAERDVAGVTWDRFDCGMQAVNYLHARGARKLLFVHLKGGKRAVMEGARHTAKAAGPALTLDEISGDQSTGVLADAILAAAPDGLAFTDDFQARDILRSLTQRSPGYCDRVPVIAIANAGFDILPHSIARLDVNGYEVGAMAMATLKTMLGGGALPSTSIGIKVRLARPLASAAPALVQTAEV